MDVLLLTNEFPPTVYGGAGVHVAELTRALRGRVNLDIRTFGGQAINEPGWRVTGYAAPPGLGTVDAAYARAEAMTADPGPADLVHCHTWYTHPAGVRLHERGLALVVTAHSLEPLRPWKREQLGADYERSAAIEKRALEAAEAVIAVSRAMADDIGRLFDVAPERIHAIPNGIDTRAFVPTDETDELSARGIDPDRPFVLFVGRITRQKGLVHLLEAVPQLEPEVGVVLAAGQADTPELQAEVERRVADVRSGRPGPLVWLPEMLDRRTLVQVYSHAAVFVCPSVYEPFGIINLEAAACGTPVVATRTGGIPEVVVDGQTGLLVDPPDDSAAAFAARLAGAIGQLLADPTRARSMGAAGRQRAVEEFDWDVVAERTVAVYRAVA